MLTAGILQLRDLRLQSYESRVKNIGFLVFSAVAFVLIVLLALRSQRSNDVERSEVTTQIAPTPLPLRGTVRVIDGDTIEVDGERVRLFGIDAPEDDQICGMEGASFLCGDAATARLRELIGQHQPNCIGDAHDRYGRLIAKCSVDGRDVGQEMVRSGWAVAFRRYSDEYVIQEREARRAERGLWQSTFQSPEQWRKEH